ncbi:MAG: ergothioneine biosynthesis glutamate--cysteine ligase EgtA [Propionibacteriaceae bacterium]|nr:ergothioneine biosynthesis glutamate--cysteine ligase EgtA [Propionibacteriaceae bacterium]
MISIEESVETGSASTAIETRDEALGYVGMICFKHGPPTLHGLELEWTVHHRAHPAAPISTRDLADALGPHAPPTITLDSPWLPLPQGSCVTIEPGGQLEISTLPCRSLSDLVQRARTDAAAVRALLEPAGLVLGELGLDPHRPPTRILHTPRYDAMQSFFDGHGPSGLEMMCSTASLQVCLDAGQAGDVSRRWQALHALGPALVALFANSPRMAGRDTGWVCGRLPRVFEIAPVTSSPPPHCVDPAEGYARMALDAPLICLRQNAGSWAPPAGLSFADWIETSSRLTGGGPVGRPPTFDDLDYHLTTLFPPVRAHGYLEVRYLDAQPGDHWVAPAMVLACLMADRMAVDQALDVTEPIAGSWLKAAREGLRDPTVARTAQQVADLGLRAVERAHLDPTLTDEITDVVQHRLATSSRRCP